MGGGDGAWLVSVLNAAKLHTEKWLNGKFRVTYILPDTHKPTRKRHFLPSQTFCEALGGTEMQKEWPKAVFWVFFFFFWVKQ